MAHFLISFHASGCWKYFTSRSTFQESTAIHLLRRQQIIAMQNSRFTLAAQHFLNSKRVAYQ